MLNYHPVKNTYLKFCFKTFLNNLKKTYFAKDYNVVENFICPYCWHNHRPSSFKSESTHRTMGKQGKQIYFKQKYKFKNSEEYTSSNFVTCS